MHARHPRRLFATGFLFAALVAAAPLPVLAQQPAPSQTAADEQEDRRVDTEKKVTGYLWLGAVVGGPVALGAMLAFVTLRRRNKNRGPDQRS